MLQGKQENVGGFQIKKKNVGPRLIVVKGERGRLCCQLCDVQYENAELSGSRSDFSPQLKFGRIKAGVVETREPVVYAIVWDKIGL